MAGTGTGAERIVADFLAAWKRGDVEELLAFFAADAVWQPGPLKPVEGTAALREAMVEWIAGAAGIRVDVRHTVSDGTVVMHERTDRFTLDGQEIETPVAAVFEVADGRITAWREYFDMSPFVGG
ncbi:SgcJ/EcaC family oxidoreductase [Mycolicibacterium palauense]|uniref:SgcJ/EcaC family oxidoreductase n=1 Tax=Mycolicibacterium palauense TaxID=2034511 RepID=UPI000BFF014C|nr:SgcJ/EcaC family oxidoreductase [Mycolicibacterium palauense]